MATWPPPPSPPSPPPPAARRQRQRRRRSAWIGVVAGLIGLSAQIAGLLGYDPSTVRRWIHRHQ
jgi:hypothetical protein